MLVTWAEVGVVLTGELLAGDQDPRPTAPNWIRGAGAALPQGTKRHQMRCDSGLFSGDLAWAAVDADADFAIAAGRNVAVCRAIQLIPKYAWRPATGMRGAAKVARYRSDGVCRFCAWLLPPTC